MRAVHSIIGSGSSPLPQASATRPAITTDHDGETATQTFNARDLDGLADVLAGDVVCRVPGGWGRGARRRASNFIAAGWRTFPTLTSRCAQGT